MDRKALTFNKKLLTYAGIIFVLSVLISLGGAMAKIQHNPIANTAMMTGMILNVVSYVLLITSFFKKAH